MGKNQMYKALQRAKHVAAMDGSLLETEDGTVDASFHTPEWHAARMAALQHQRMSWEEFKQKIKKDAESESKRQEEEERVMLEYRAQLAADREKKMNRNATDSRAGRRKRRNEKERRRLKKRDHKLKHDKRRGTYKSNRKRSPASGSMSFSEDSSPIRLSEYLKS